jgi:CHAT domain-containing protein
MWEKALGPYHGNTLLSLGNIASTYAAMGDIANAIKFQTLTEEAVEKNLTLNLAIGSERQKLAYFDSLANRTDRTISLHVNLAPQDPAARDLAAQVILQRKGRVLDAMSGSLAALRQRLDPDDQALLDQLNTTAADLAKLALNGPQKMDAAEYRKELKALEDQNEKLQAEISRRSAQFRAESQPVSLDAVKAVIPNNAALIEFATYRPFDPKTEGEAEQYGKPRYVAYVIRKQGGVQWKDLGEAQAIDEEVDKLRQALRDPKRDDVRELARTTDEMVMRPIRALIGDASQLLISPDGELNLIPFAALIDEDGRYFVERYSLTYLTSGRDLLRMRVARESKSKPVVMANPAFGESGAESLAKTKSPTTSVASNNKRRSIKTGKDLSEAYFAPLGGTLEEARTIQSLFPEATLLTGEQATESALKAVAAPRILHVATHGFFLTDAGDAPPAATRGNGASNGLENPLLRSGLALAGANLRGSGEGDYGIVTALEASSLNLWGTKLAVLSACDTGVGEVRNGEGVYGLRRAFVLAGAESLLMSLWPVSDYSTRRLMADYYKNLKNGMGRGAALREVQLQLLKSNPQLHPFYWANFIQSGDWANLDGKR